jgi:hypothetical protein
MLDSVRKCFSWLTAQYLKRAVDRESETHKSGLQLRANEHRVMYEKLVQVLPECTAKLLRLFKAVKCLVSPLDWSGEPGKPTKLEIVIQLNTEFDEYFYPNRLYLPPDLFQLIAQFHKKLAGVASDFRRGMAREMSDPNYKGSHWETCGKVLDEEASPLFDEIHDKCQQVLGIPFSTRHMVSLSR